MIKTLYIKYVGLLIKIKTWLIYIGYFKTKPIANYLFSKLIRNKNKYNPEIKNEEDNPNSWRNRFDR